MFAASLIMISDHHKTMIPTHPLCRGSSLPMPRPEQSGLPDPVELDEPLWLLIQDTAIVQVCSIMKSILRFQD